MVLVGIAEVFVGIGFALLASVAVIFTFRHVVKLGDMQEKLKANDAASALFHSAGFVALAIVVRPSIDGAFAAFDLLAQSGGWNWANVLSFIGYTLLHISVGLVTGVLVIVVGVWLFDRLTRRVEELEEVEHGNLSAAILLAGVLFLVAWLTSPGLSRVLEGLLPWPDIANTIAVGQ